LISVRENLIGVQNHQCKEYERFDEKPIELFLSHGAQIKVGIRIEQEQSTQNDESHRPRLIEPAVTRGHHHRKELEIWHQAPCSVRFVLCFEPAFNQIVQIVVKS